MTHIGQEIALGTIGVLGRRLGFVQLGDVDAKTDAKTLGRHPLDDAQPTSGVGLLDEIGAATAMGDHAFGNPGIDTPDGFGVLAAFGAGPDDLLETAPGDEDIRRSLVIAPIALVAIGQPVVGVVDDEGLVERVDGRPEHFLALLDLPPHLLLRRTRAEL